MTTFMIVGVALVALFIIAILAACAIEWFENLPERDEFTSMDFANDAAFIARLCRHLPAVEEIAREPQKHAYA